MKMLKISTILMGLALFGFAGCGSSDSTADADIGTPDGGVTPFAITPGPYCYKITGVSAVNDGCDLKVAGMVGTSLPGDYEPTPDGILTLGTQGSLGGGQIRNNQGTLIRVKDTVSDPSLPGCSWNQADTTLVTVTGTNKFTVAVTEDQDTIAAACGAAAATCQSTWTWTMELTTAPISGQCP